MKIFGGVGEVDGEMAALLARYDIFAESFGARVFVEFLCEGVDWMVFKEEIEKRRDLCYYRVCLIDFLGCIDVDDVLSVYVLVDCVEIGVYIVDVLYFVCFGMLFDYEV